MYLDKNGKEIPSTDIEDKESGLFAMNWQKQIIQIKIPRNSLAFQVGESSQILSGGLLKATPHAVMSNPLGKGISRNTFACFLGPNYKEIMSTPDGKSGINVYKPSVIAKVPGLEKRWTEGCTFETFEHNTFSQYYAY